MCIYDIKAVEIGNAGVVGADPGVSGQFRHGNNSASTPPSGVTDRFSQMVADVKDILKQDSRGAWMAAFYSSVRSVNFQPMALKLRQLEGGYHTAIASRLELVAGSREATSATL